MCCLSESTARTSAVSGDAAFWRQKPKSFFVPCTSIMDWEDHSLVGRRMLEAYLYVARSSVSHVYVVVSDSLGLLKQ